MNKQAKRYVVTAKTVSPGGFIDSYDNEDKAVELAEKYRTRAVSYAKDVVEVIVTDTVSGDTLMSFKLDQDAQFEGGGGVNNICLETLARLIIAHRAYRDGEVRFAGEVLAGAWTHENRADIAEVLAILSEKPSTVAAWLNDIGKRW